MAVTIVKTDPIVHSTGVHALLHELYEFENMKSELSAEQLKTDLIKGLCHSLVALNDQNVPVGHTLYYHAYSSSNGPFLFMEDLYVTPEYRSQGIGKSLWCEVAKVAHDEKLSRIEWTVLNWNSNAIGFYKKMGAIDMSEKEGILLYRLYPENIEKLAAQK